MPVNRATKGGARRQRRTPAARPRTKGHRERRLASLSNDNQPSQIALHERRKLAQVFHDQLQQLLTGAQFNLHALRRYCVPGEMERIVDSVGSALQAAQASCASLTYEIRPRSRLETGLAPALQGLHDWLRQQIEAPLDRSTTKEVRVHDERLRIMLHQAVRELLFTAVKQADIRTAVVTAAVGDRQDVQIVVEDRSARSFATTTDETTGMAAALAPLSIREQLRRIDGYLRVEISPSQGSRFTLVVPKPSVGH